MKQHVHVNHGFRVLVCMAKEYTQIGDEMQAIRLYKTVIDKYPFYNPARPPLEELLRAQSDLAS